MRTKIISNLTIAQLACLPLISISCGKHEQKAKENLVAVASNPKFDKLIDKNKKEKTDKNTPIVEKIEIVNNGESESKQIEKSKKVEVKNQNNSNLPINVEVKNDIKIDNKINTKESKLKTFFAVIGGLATATAVGYGIYWLFKDNIYYEIKSETQNNETSANDTSIQKNTITIKFKNKSKVKLFQDEVKNRVDVGYTIIHQRQQWINIGNDLIGEITFNGNIWNITDIITKYHSEITNIEKKSKKNWEKVWEIIKDLFKK